MSNVEAKLKMLRFPEMAKKVSQDLARGVLKEFGYRLVARSPIGDPTHWRPAHWPVGYVPGQFVNNWQVGIDDVPRGIIGQADASGSGSYERLQKLGRWQIGHTFYFVNNLPYAKLLENGWSRSQAPLGIVGLTMAELPQIINDVKGAYSINGRI